MSVFLRDRTHTYLLIARDAYSGRFLTIDNGIVEVAIVPLLDGSYAVGHDTLVPYSYDFIAAVEKYHSSHLTKTPEAEAEMAAILGLRPPETVAPPARIIHKAISDEPKGSTYSLTDLCSDLKMEPGEARKILRHKKVQKPGARWEWANAEAASHIRSLLV